LRNISARGNVIINIDHYYYQNSKTHPPGYDEWVNSKRKQLEYLTESNKQEQFMKTKIALLDIYKKDIFFVMAHLSDILKNDPNVHLEKLVLMGHSIGGNADKKVIEELAQSEKDKIKVKAFVSFDSRLNQLGLKTTFEVPTLVLGAFSWYTLKSDPLRQIPPQKNLRLKVLKYTTHVSFDDVSILSTLEKDLEPLKSGMNEFASQDLMMNIKHIRSGNAERFGERLFLGGKKEMTQFVEEVSHEVDDFLKKIEPTLIRKYSYKTLLADH
jgi:dienelactone hydrolase